MESSKKNQRCRRFHVSFNRELFGNIQNQAATAEEIASATD
jgi:hypothetical protein